MLDVVRRICRVSCDDAKDLFMDALEVEENDFTLFLSNGRRCSGAGQKL